MSGSEEDSTSAIESRLHSNKKHLAKLKIIHKQKMKKDSLSHSNRMIKYHGLYHDSSGEQFYLPKAWKKLTMIGRGQEKEKRNHHWQQSKINYEFDDDEMNGTQ